MSLEIASNEILCVVGESGSGKSMANAVMRLMPNEVTIDGGRVMFEGRDLCAASVAEMREVRGAGIAVIFQEPMTALNPLRTIGDQIAEMFLHPHRFVEGRDRHAGAGAGRRPHSRSEAGSRPIRTSSPAASASAP